MIYTVSFEGEDFSGTYWFDVEADDSLAALTAAGEVFGDECGQPGGQVTAEAHVVSVPVELSSGELTECGNGCGKAIPHGFVVCSKECAAEVNEVADPESRVLRHDYPSSDGKWHVCWRPSERGFRACFLGRDALHKPEHGGDPYDWQRPLRYDERLYPDEPPALARAEALNGVVA